MSWGQVQEKCLPGRMQGARRVGEVTKRSWIWGRRSEGKREEDKAWNQGFAGRGKGLGFYCEEEETLPWDTSGTSGNRDVKRDGICSFVYSLHVQPSSVGLLLDLAPHPKCFPQPSFWNAAFHGGRDVLLLCLWLCASCKIPSLGSFLAKSNVRRFSSAFHLWAKSPAS